MARNAFEDVLAEILVLLAALAGLPTASLYHENDKFEEKDV